MTYHHSHEEDVPPPMESIAGLMYSPTTDIPFGKHIRLGQKDQFVFQSSVEKGYQAGIIAHLKFMEANQFDEPVMLDDTQFTMVIEHVLPPDLSIYDRGLWRSHFIVGWTSVYLGVANEVEVDEHS